MTRQSRPLSPHLQVYRWQLTSVLSIVHRGTGLVMSAALLAFAGWLLAAAAGAEAYAAVAAFFGSLPGLVLLAGISFAFFYHLCNGVRHLVWDTGAWLGIPAVYASGWAVVALSALLTIVAWSVVALRMADPS
jgi:succinate dehydrogenase / fumarate reductase, cytochrome b subunit